MAFQSVPETVEIAVLFTTNSVPMQNTYHARLEGGYSEAEMDLLADAIDDAVTTYQKPYWSNATTYDGVEIRGLENETDIVVTNGDGAGGGGIANSPVPNNVAFAIRKLSGLTGRSARGRVYIGGFPTQSLATDENYMATAQVTNWENGVDAVKDAITAEGWDPVIVSRFHNGVKRSEGVTYPWLTTSAKDERLDTRRDRLP